MKFATIAIAIASIFWVFRRKPDTTTSGEYEAQQDTSAAAPLWNIADLISEQINITPMIDQDTATANTAAFLAMIRRAEGTASERGYQTLFGGSLFDSFADHPRRAIQFTDKAGRRLWTTAAGAYQFMAISPIPTGGSTRVNTWDRIAAKLGLSDFSPASQDAAAVELIREAGALADVRAGRFDQAVSKVRGIWASMPGAGYAQPEKSIESLRVAYLENGGTLA
jgi:lysozyme